MSPDCARVGRALAQTSTRSNFPPSSTSPNPTVFRRVQTILKVVSVTISYSTQFPYSIRLTSGVEPQLLQSLYGGRWLYKWLWMLIHAIRLCTASRAASGAAGSQLRKTNGEQPHSAANQMGGRAVRKTLTTCGCIIDSSTWSSSTSTALAAQVKPRAQNRNIIDHCI